MVHFGPPDVSFRRAEVPEARDSFAAWQKRRSNPRVLVLRGRSRPAKAGSSVRALAIPLFSDVDSVIDALAETTDD